MVLEVLSLLLLLLLLFLCLEGCFSSLLCFTQTRRTRYTILLLQSFQDVFCPQRLLCCLRNTRKDGRYNIMERREERHCYSSWVRQLLATPFFSSPRVSFKRFIRLSIFFTCCCLTRKKDSCFSYTRIGFFAIEFLFFSGVTGLSLAFGLLCQRRSQSVETESKTIKPDFSGK